jgi:phage baseplate assembly protein gpV
MAIHELVELASRVAELERRFSGVMRHGTVEEVDPAKQIMRLKFGESEDGKPFLSPWIPYAQVAGALKVHTPPSKGQQFTMLSPTGDWQQAVGLPMTWSNQNPSPSENGDEHVLTFGQVKGTIKEKLFDTKVGDTQVEQTDSKVTIKAGGVTVEISGGGVKITGGMVTHEGKNIGSTHKHGESMPGPALTGPPAA